MNGEMLIPRRGNEMSVLHDRLTYSRGNGYAYAPQPWLQPYPGPEHFAEEEGRREKKNIGKRSILVNRVSHFLVKSNRSEHSMYRKIVAQDMRPGSSQRADPMCTTRSSPLLKVDLDSLWSRWSSVLNFSRSRSSKCSTVLVPTFRPASPPSSPWAEASLLLLMLLTSLITSESECGLFAAAHARLFLAVLLVPVPTVAIWPAVSFSLVDMSEIWRSWMIKRITGNV